MTQTNALTLGILRNVEHTPFVDFVQKTLTDAGINAAIQYFDEQADLNKAVIEGTVSAYACPLHLTPLTLPLGLTISALSERKSAQSALFTKNIHNPDMGETEGGVIEKVLALSDIDRALMQYLQPNYAVGKTKLTANESLKAIRLGAFDAVILSSFTRRTRQRA